MKDGQIQNSMGTANHSRTLFKPGSWLTKIDFINHLVLFNNVLVTVLSEKSGGKTSFSALLLNHLDQQIKPVFMSPQPPCDRNDFLGDIAAQLHLNIDADTNINALVAQINERKAPVLLVIDDAQHLPEDLIKEFLIAIHHQEDYGFFHLCLISDYSVLATLNNLAGDQFNNLIHTIELGSLNESETRTYVLQRAMAARLLTKPLTDNQFKKFYQITKGSIAKINQELESFVFKCAAQKEISSASVVKRTIIAASILALAGVSYLYVNYLYSINKEKTVLASNLPVIYQAMNGQVDGVAYEEIASSYVPTWRDLAVVQLVQNELPKRQVLDAEEGATNTVALVDKVIVIPEIKKPQLGTEVVHASIHAAYERQAKPVTRISSKAALPAKKLISKPLISKKTIVNSVARSSGFTIQLIASRNKNDVYRFKQSNKVYAATKIRHFTNQKGGWYILTIGEFSTRAEAVKKTQALPVQLSKLNPWVRPITGLTSAG